jgi:hypothetical protein
MLMPPIKKVELLIVLDDAITVKVGGSSEIAAGDGKEVHVLLPSGGPQLEELPTSATKILFQAIFFLLELTLADYWGRCKRSSPSDHHQTQIHTFQRPLLTYLAPQLGI